jgi:hypothetical protein
MLFKLARVKYLNGFFGGLVPLLLTGCPATLPCPGKTAAEQQICSNCTSNLDITTVDYMACAAETPDSASSCTNVKKDLAQLSQLNSANKPSTEEATRHLDACQGKGDDNVDCKAVKDAITQLKCD